ncbi:MAG: flavodoxin family protein [Eubacterium sp.]|nr:flavodoxin family protein [Eubacterium sp.]
MKLAVIYDSKTGNTQQAGEWIVEGMNGIPGVQAKAFSIDDVDQDFVKEAKGIVAGSPSYAAAMTPALHAWLLENGGQLGFAGKLGGAYATEQFTHGGGESVIQNILTIEMVNGMLCYSSGGACGAPYIHLGPIGVNNNVEKHNGMDYYKDYFTIFGKRFADKALELFND